MRSVVPSRQTEFQTCTGTAARAWSKPRFAGGPSAHRFRALTPCPFRWALTGISSSCRSIQPFFPLTRNLTVSTNEYNVGFANNVSRTNVRRHDVGFL